SIAYEVHRISMNLMCCNPAVKQNPSIWTGHRNFDASGVTRLTAHIKASDLKYLVNPINANASMWNKAMLRRVVPKTPKFVAKGRQSFKRAFDVHCIDGIAIQRISNFDTKRPRLWNRRFKLSFSIR